jgi:hypothetical protein
MNEYEQTPEEKIAFIEPGLKELYRQKYGFEINIACQQVVDDLRPAPKDENGKPLRREGKPVPLGESEAMKELVIGLAQAIARIRVLEDEIARLKELQQAAQTEPSLNGSDKS